MEFFVVVVVVYYICQPYSIFHDRRQSKHFVLCQTPEMDSAYLLLPRSHHKHAPNMRHSRLFFFLFFSPLSLVTHHARPRSASDTSIQSSRRLRHSTCGWQRWGHPRRQIEQFTLHTRSANGKRCEDFGRRVCCLPPKRSGGLCLSWPRKLGVVRKPKMVAVGPSRYGPL